MTGKYTALGDYLAGVPAHAQQVRMTFEEVAALVDGLPPSAYSYRPWWGDDSHGQVQAWRGAGWQVDTVDLTAESVLFVRGRGGGRAGAQAVRPAATRPAVDDSGMPAAEVQTRLVSHLAAHGWRILRTSDTASGERGVDVLAERAGRTLAAQVKGYPGREYSDPRRTGERAAGYPAAQARHWYADALLSAMLVRDDQPGYDLAVAVPDVPTYRTLHARTRGGLERIGVTVLFVTPAGEITSR